MPKILYATTNPGKLQEARDFCEPRGVTVLSVDDLGLPTIDVEETGNSLQENARLKVKEFREIATKRNLFVIADDSGLEIDALHGEPGIHVRRWRDKTTRMTDEEIISYCLERLDGVPRDKRTARFHIVIALVLPQGVIELFDGFLDGYIQEQAADFRMKGFPFESLFYVTEWRMLLGEFHQLPDEKRKKYLTHRGIALEKVLERIAI